MNTPSFDVLLSYKHSRDPQVVRNLLAVFGTIANKESLASLVDIATESDDAGLRRRAAEELARVCQAGHQQEVTDRMRDVLLRADAAQKVWMSELIAELRARGWYADVRGTGWQTRWRTATATYGLSGRRVIGALVLSVLLGLLTAGIVETVYDVAGPDITATAILLALVSGGLVATLLLRRVPLAGAFDPAMTLALDSALSAMAALVLGLGIGLIAQLDGLSGPQALAMTALTAAVLIATYTAIHVSGAMFGLSSVKTVRIAVQAIANVVIGVLVLVAATEAARLVAYSPSLLETPVPLVVEGTLHLAIPSIVTLGLLIALVNQGRVVRARRIGMWRAVRALTVLVAAAGLTTVILHRLSSSPRVLEVKAGESRTEVGDLHASETWVTIDSRFAQRVNLEVVRPEQNSAERTAANRTPAVGIYSWLPGPEPDSRRCLSRPDFEKSEPLQVGQSGSLEVSIGWGCYAFLIVQTQTGYIAPTLTRLLDQIASERRTAAATWRTTLNMDAAGLLSDGAELAVGFTSRLYEPVPPPIGQKDGASGPKPEERLNVKVSKALQLSYVTLQPGELVPASISCGPSSGPPRDAFGPPMGQAARPERRPPSPISVRIEGGNFKADESLADAGATLAPGDYTLVVKTDRGGAPVTTPTLLTFRASAVGPIAGDGKDLPVTEFVKGADHTVSFKVQECGIILAKLEQLSGVDLRIELRNATGIIASGDDPEIIQVQLPRGLYTLNVAPYDTGFRGVPLKTQLKLEISVVPPATGK